MALNNQKLTTILKSYLQARRLGLTEDFGETNTENIMKALDHLHSWSCVDAEGVSGSRPPECYPKGAKAYKLFVLNFSAKGLGPETLLHRMLFRCHIWYNQQEAILIDYERTIEPANYNKVE